MARDYIVIQRFNDGYIGRNLGDSKYVFVRGEEVSQSFNTIKGLSDTWKKDQMKMSKDGTQSTTSEPRELSGTLPDTLPASEATAERTTGSRRDRDTRNSQASEAGTDVALPIGQEVQLGEAPTATEPVTAPAIAPTEKPATAKPTRRRTTRKKK